MISFVRSSSTICDIFPLAGRSAAQTFQQLADARIFVLDGAMTLIRCQSQPLALLISDTMVANSRPIMLIQPRVRLGLKVKRCSPQGLSNGNGLCDELRRLLSQQSNSIPGQSNWLRLSKHIVHPALWSIACKVQVYPGECAMNQQEYNDSIYAIRCSSSQAHPANRIAYQQEIQIKFAEDPSVTPIMVCMCLT